VQVIGLGDLSQFIRFQSLSCQPLSAVLQLVAKPDGPALEKLMALERDRSDRRRLPRVSLQRIEDAGRAV
jgi:hypothetical protein